MVRSEYRKGSGAFRLELRTKTDPGKFAWHGLENDKQHAFTTDPYTGSWRRFGIGFLSLLPIESQL
ncbi:MAG: hypothetical protein JRG99_12300 [Deltaproteobacteria bacterium]|nr:hypothetical protein [Deltaproteobacteria bacterium]MBW2228062.1 hypothetical protein [Deltaproteobacteria bacterium]